MNVTMRHHVIVRRMPGTYNDGESGILKPMSSCNPSSDPCHFGRESQMTLLTLKEVVDRYIKVCRKQRKAEREFHAKPETLKEAVEKAVSCEKEGGGRHPHQRRITRAALGKAKQKLTAKSLGEPACFDELHSRVEERIRGIHGIGPLTVYDIALRIGCFCSLEPEKVYLHSGALAGAKALRLNFSQKMISTAMVPPEFKKLKPYEIEDCLCIYKDQLKKVSKA